MKRLPRIVFLLCVSVCPWLSFAAATQTPQAPPRPQPPGRLFPPQELGLLEAPDRDIWQRPDQVMDALAIADASIVVDFGAGGGWFTIHLARRVGPNGRVYAQDVQQEMIASISRRMLREGLTNVTPILGEEGNPNLQSTVRAGSVDAVLMVDTYHEIKDRVTSLSNLARYLKPQGRIGVVDFKLEGGGPGPPMQERVSPEIVVADAGKAGLRLLSQETFLPYQYFLIFGRAPTSKD